MIVRDDGDRLLLIRQTDHAALSGRLAEHWGNDAFDRPDPLASVVYAAARHDDGWIAWETAPKIDPDTRRPYQFTDLPIDEHWHFYSAGLAEIVRHDRYAALLSGMHLASLYRMKLAAGTGLRVNDTSRDANEVGQACIRQLEAQQRQLREELVQVGDPLRVADECRVRVNFRWLQLFDLLSLYFCTGPVKDATYGPVPRNYDRDETKLTLRRVDSRTVSMTPYPFSVDPLHLAVAGRSLSTEPYDSDQHLQEALANARSVTLAFTIQSA